MFAVIEWFEENGDNVHTCIAHCKFEKDADKELALWAKPEYPIDAAFSYEIVAYDDGDYCPMCGRNFEF